MPRRIQVKRKKGWRMPSGAVYVGRPTRWGNPFRPGEEAAARAEVVALFAEMFAALPEPEQAELLAPLRGRDLACWCPLGEPCHADYLLVRANEED